MIRISSCAVRAFPSASWRAPWSALGIALLVAACSSSKGKDGLPPATGSGAPPPPAIPRLEQVASANKVATETVAAWTGSLVSRHEAQLGPKMTGILSEITVEEGDRVKKGQLLFRLDSVQSALVVSQAKAGLASAEVSYGAAKLELDRATELMKGGSIAQASYDRAKATHDSALSGIDQARTAVRMAERAAGDTAVYSPIDGVVTAKAKSLGETVTMMPPTVVLVVQDVEQLELRARLPESALASVREGTVLRFFVRSMGVTREVPVKRVNPTIDVRTRTVEVVADVENEDRALKAGMLVEVALASAGPKTEVPAPSVSKLADAEGTAKAGAKAP